MPEDLNQKKHQISWDMLNLCIGSIFQVWERKKEFTTADVANMLTTHGVEVTNRPNNLLQHPATSIKK